MSVLPLDKIRRNNSNIHTCDDAARSMYRALRKERGANPNLAEDYMLFAPLMLPAVENPYSTCDLKIDMDRFTATLDPLHAEVFGYYRAGFTHRQIMESTGTSLATAYRRVDHVIDRFKEFYTGDH